MLYWRVLACLCLMFGVSPATAHLLNMSKARIELAPRGQVTVTLELDLLRTAGDRQSYYALSQRLDPSDDPEVLALLSALPAAIRIELDDQAIPLTLTAVRFPDEPEATFLDPLSWPRTQLTLVGSVNERDISTTNLVVRFTDEFFFEEPIATTIIDATTGINQTRWLVTGQRSPGFDASAWLSRNPQTATSNSVGFGPQFVSYVIAGVRHILPGGFDHLLFVAGLLLASRSIRQLIITVSLFTLAHSVTLIAGALGWVQPSAWLIEPLILTSILWVGFVNLRAADAGNASRLAVFAFGLLHGFGFAGALRELELPAEQTITALLAFNIGVEVGQLGFLAMLLVLYALVAQRLRPVPDIGLLPIATPVRRIGGGVLIVATLWLLLGLAGVI